MRLGGSVYDRAQKTGYLLGPRHRYESALEEASGPPPSENEGDENDKPPNLRDAGDSPDSCGGCAHFEPGDMAEAGGSSCSLHGGYPVSVNQVCDDFEGGEGEGEEEGGPPELMPPMPGGR